VSNFVSREVMHVSSDAKRLFIVLLSDIKKLVFTRIPMRTASVGMPMVRYNCVSVMRFP
jgi:hypothetical protein